MTEEKENLADLLEEQKFVKQILENGITIDIISRSPRAWFLSRRDPMGRKVRKIKITAPMLNTMDHAAESKLQIKINLANLEENPVRVKNQIIKDNAFLMCKVIAIYYLNRGWKIKMFANILGRYIADRIDGGMMSDAYQGLEVLEDAGTFISSTVSASGTPRTTKPKAEKIE